jgi:hypothetical protein
MGARTVITLGTFDVCHDVLLMGEDWAGTSDWVSDACEVVYLPPTPSASTTGIIEHLASMGS